MTLQRPAPDEYDAYYGLYIDQAPEGDVLEHLATELEATRQALGSLSEEQELMSYADGKWSLREMVGHLIDTEWVFNSRALCFARTEPAQLPSCPDWVHADGS